MKVSNNGSKQGAHPPGGKLGGSKGKMPHGDAPGKGAHMGGFPGKGPGGPDGHKPMGDDKFGGSSFFGHGPGRPLDAMNGPHGPQGKFPEMKHMGGAQPTDSGDS